MLKRTLAVAVLVGALLPAAAAAAPFSHVLWTRNAGGKAALWKLDPATGALVSRRPVSRAGIGARWQATDYAHVDDATGFVLVSRGDTGQAALWQVNPGTGGVSRKIWVARKGIGKGWQATGYVRASAAVGYVLWSRGTRGQAQVWTVNPKKGARRAVVRVGPASGIGVGWLASGYACVDAGTARVLWTNGGAGRAEVWTIDPANGARRSVLPVALPAGKGPGWKANDYDRVTATVAAVLWAHDRNGQAEVWTVDLATGDPMAGWPAGSAAGGGIGWQATSYTDGGGGVQCESCHGNPPHPGLDGIPGSGDDAPQVMGDGTSAGGVGAVPKPFDDGSWGYNVNGHGANGTAPATPDRNPGGEPDRLHPNAACADCHDIAQPSAGHGRHLDGVLNSAEQGLNTSGNTAHLISSFIGPSSPSSGVQSAFDKACYLRCHAGATPRVEYMGHAGSAGIARFGAAATWSDGEGLPWPVDSDLSANASVDEPDYAPCVSCHNPHGTDVAEPRAPWNRMVRAPWISQSTLCLACHR